MFSIEAVSAALSSLKTSIDLLNAFRSASGVTKIDNDIVEITRIIMSAQESCLAAYSTQVTLLKEKDEMERKLRQFKSWDAEKNKYALKDVGNGQLAYALKEVMSDGGPHHYLCPNCYNDRRKSILQPFKGHIGTYLKCHPCALELTIA